MHTVSVFFADTYNFIAETILPTLYWPDFELILESYRAKRFASSYAYVDVLPILTCVAVGGDPDKAIPLAAAWTLYSLAARIFDDLQDDEGHDNLWNQAGWQGALPVGLYAVGAAQASLAHLAADSQTRNEIWGAFGQTMALAAIAQGQSDKYDSVEDYFKNQAAKTGLVFATGSWSGGRLVLEPGNKALDALYQYGLNAGMMVQILDDCRDLGGVDLSSGTITLPVIYALAQQSHPEWSRLHALLADESHVEHLETIITLLSEFGAVEWSLRVAQVYKKKAIAALVPFPSERVEPLVAYMVGSTYDST